MKTALVLMTALLPTTGHADIVRFAASLPGTRVSVLVNGRSFEPVDLGDRVESLRESLQGWGNIEVFGSLNDEAPQNPPDHPDFWAWWRNECLSQTGAMGYDFLVASEPYGKQLADTLGATFLPYDVERVLNSNKGQLVRSDIPGSWDSILNPLRSKLLVTGTLFGQESVGKTTVSRLVAERLNGTWLFEYARPYQELLGPQVDEEVMENIHRGQLALQSTHTRLSRRPFLVQDTDLYSTVGYWGIMGQEPSAELVYDARAWASDAYYLMPDTIPFVADQLRYGVDKRESTTEYWADLLREHGMPLVRVPSGTIGEKVDFIAESMLSLQEEKIGAIRDFLRD